MSFAQLLNQFVRQHHLRVLRRQQGRQGVSAGSCLRFLRVGENAQGLAAEFLVRMQSLGLPVVVAEFGDCLLPSLIH